MIKEVVETIMGIVNNPKLSNEDKEKAITEVLVEEVKEPLIENAVEWLNENTYEVTDDTETYLKMLYHESFEAMTELRSVHMVAD